MAIAKPPGLSVSEAELLDHLSEHARSEGELLSAYGRLADAAASPWVSYLTEILVEEETRHHRYFEELANALRARVERGVGGSVPMLTPVKDPAELVAAIDRLLEAERSDAKELKRLSRRLRSMRGVSLWPLLVELMERDTEKHIGILRFLRLRLRGR